MTSRLFDPKYLTGYYKLNGAKDSSGLVRDFSGNGNSGTITGVEAYSTNLFNKQSQVFTGNEHINLGNKFGFTTQDFSITFVINPNTSVTTIDKNIITKYTATGDKRSWRIDYDGTVQRVMLYTSSTGGVSGDALKIVSTPNNSVLRGIYSIISITRSGTTIKFYINGILVTTGITSSSIYSSDTTSTLIAARDNGSLKFIGNINDMMIHDGIALTDEEVSKLHSYLRIPQTYSPPQTLGLVSDGVDDYINTGINDTIDISYEIIGKLITKADVVFIGTRRASDNQNLYIGCSSTAWRYAYGTSVIDIEQYDDKINKWEMSSNGIFRKNNIVVSDQSAISRTPTNYPIFLYCRNLDSTTSKLSNFILHECKIWQSGVLVRHFIPKTNGKFNDLVTGVEYGNSGSGSLISQYSQLKIDDYQLLFSTRDGITDLANRSTITTTNAIVGKGINFTNGTISISSSFSIYTLVYVFEDPTTHIISHYVIQGDIIYKNGVVYEDSIPFGSNVWDDNDLWIDSSIDSDVIMTISPFTGIIHKLEMYNDIKSIDWIKNDYEREIQYW